MKNEKKRIQTIVNVTSSVLLLIVNLAINFWLSPVIVRSIGVEAQGFVTLANTFVTYANLIVMSLNGMASRFITIEYHKGNLQKANLYYNSVFWGNLVIVLVLIAPSAFFVAFLQNVLSIPEELIFDVKVLFAIVFGVFFLQTGLPNWNVGAYVANKLDREYLPNLLTVALKGSVLFLMFTFLLPKVWYVGAASAGASILLLLFEFFNTKKLTPELRVRLSSGNRLFSWNAVKELVGAGIWGAASDLGVIFFNGLDLLVTNVLLGSTAMGVLSIAKTLPSISDQLRQSISRAFLPELTIDYAKKDFQSMKQKIDKSMQLTAFVMVIVVAGIVIMSGDFYRLWMPEQDFRKLQILVILSLAGYYISNGMSVLYNVFSVVNKVKQNALVLLFSGFVSFVFTYLLVKFTDYGVYAICAVSSIVGLTKNVLFVIPYSAKYLGFKWFTFFPNILRSFVGCCLLTAVGYGISLLIPKGGWLMFFLTSGSIAISGVMLGWFIVLNRYSRVAILNLFRRA